MTDEEKKLIDLFTQQKGLVEKDASIHAAYSPAAEALSQGERTARDLYSQGEQLEWNDTQRQGMGGARFPDLQGTAELFSAALGKHPDLVAEVLAGPPVWDNLVKLDQALGRYIWAAQLLWRGGENGEVITGATAQGLCLRSLDEANARQADQSRPLDERTAITMAFTEPNRINDERKARDLQVQKTTDKSGQPAKDQISQVADDAAMARAIDAYLATRTDA